MRNIPASVWLPSTYNGQSIGYSILNVSRETFLGFTLAGVVMPFPRYWAVSGGVQVPDAGGFIVWGLENNPLAEATVDPAPVDTSQEWLIQIGAMLAHAIERIVAVMPATPPAPVVQMDTSSFESTVEALGVRVAELIQERNQEQAVTVSEIQAQLATLTMLNDAARQTAALRAIQERISEVIGNPGIITVVNDGGSGAQMTRMLESVVDKLSEVSETIQVNKKLDAKLQKAFAALDTFETTIATRTGA